MKEYKGKRVYEGIAIGRITFLRKKEQTVTRRRVAEPASEKIRYQKARDAALDDLQALYEKSRQEIGEADAQIFEVHAMMLEDDDYNNAINHMIESQSLNAEYAVAATGDNFSKTFAAMDDEYFRARAEDIKDISERVIRNLTGEADLVINAEEPMILAAEDLTPSETVQLDKSKILAFVTRKGSSNSHTALLARTMNIPAVIQIEVDESMDGKYGILDGEKGLLIIEPDAETVKSYETLIAEQNRERELLSELRGKTDETKSGKQVKLYANVANVSDIAAALQNDACGIGLFRSEFLYLERTDYPSEEEQFEVYKRAAELMAGKPVINPYKINETMLFGF